MALCSVSDLQSKAEEQMKMTKKEKKVGTLAL
jgi:hypothetical protein